MSSEARTETKVIEIKNRFTGEVLFTSEAETLGEAILEAIRKKADLRYADLSYADLSYADLRYADLRYADLRYADLSSANLSSADLPAVDAMPELRAMIRERVESNPKCLDMHQWHSCETTHCLAGWATTLHPQGKLLESMIGPNAAGALIFNASCGEVPNFMASNEQALEWLRN